MRSTSSQAHSKLHQIESGLMASDILVASRVFEPTISITCVESTTTVSESAPDLTGLQLNISQYINVFVMVTGLVRVLHEMCVYNKRIIKWITCVTAAGWRAGNTWLNFVWPRSNPAGARTRLLQQPDLLW